MKKLFLSLEDSQDNRLLKSCIARLDRFELTGPDADAFTVIVNGPLTELSELLMRNCRLKDHIEMILLVGGSDRYGDVTMVAEKNIYADPKAAQHVMLAGIPIIWFALNTTRDLENRALSPLIYLLRPEIFVTEECGVYVETVSSKALGQTVTDIYSDKQFPDHFARLVLSIDQSEYQKTVQSLLNQ